MSDTSLNKIIQYGTTADRVAFTPDPAVGSQVLYIWYDTDNAPNTYIWDGSAWVIINSGGGGSGITQLTSDVTAGPGSGSQAATIAANAVGNTKLRDSGALSVIGRSANSSGDPADISATPAADSVLRESGSTLGFGTIATGGIANDAVTYAKIQNISATSRILGRKTSGAGDTEECTLSEILDFIGSAAQGDILYRDSSGWARLAAGASGKFLKTQGAAANPVWDTPSGSGGSPWSVIATQALSGAASYDFINLAAYTDIRVIVKACTFGSNSQAVLRVSVDNGSTFLSASGDYLAILGNGSESATNLLQFYDALVTTAKSSEIYLEGINLTTPPKVARVNFFSTDGINVRFMPTTSAVNAIRLFNSAAVNFTGGTAYVLGRT